MAAAQVAHFRSESTSPVAPLLSSTAAGGRHHHTSTRNMATAGPSSSSNNVSDNIANSTSNNNSEGITALMLACQQGRSEDVQKILRKKINAVKDRTRSGKVALHFCAESGSTTCFDHILAAEPFLINAQDEEGYTALHLAVINGNKDIVRKLIAAGADLNCLDNERHSLVHWATVCGEVEILEVLLSNKAPASTPDIHLAHPIHYAAQMCGTVNGVGSVSHARVQSTVYGVSPKKGLQILKRLIQYGCPIDVRDQDQRVPLLWAASAGGVHLHRRKYEAKTRVHKAYSFVGSGDAILLLVNAGAKPDSSDKDGLTDEEGHFSVHCWTKLSRLRLTNPYTIARIYPKAIDSALHCAASRGHTDCLETLIGLCGSEVDTIDNNGCTALFYAVTLGHADCTELLLNYGAEPNRQDRKGRTPGHCGAAKGQLETLKLLSRHGGNLWLRNVRGDLPLHDAVLSRRKDLVMWLLSQRPDSINLPNNDGRCPIHLAALNNNVEMVKILIDYRADVNLLMRSGKGSAMTPLDAAIHKGNSAVAKFLQCHGGLPSNSLNDAALHRRMNRSIEGQISPGGSMPGSQLGSHHHPSPDDPQRTFTSPEVFDSSLNNYSRNAYDKRVGHPTGPFIATSTPIMDDSVQTDTHYLRDIEVQVSDGFDDKHIKNGNTEENNQHHRKSERRRRRKSRQDGQETTSDSSPDRSSNQLASRASRKSSRRSHSNSSARNSEAKITDEVKEESSKNTSFEKSETDLKNQPKVKKKGVTPQESSDTLLDNTMMSEKFSELENVAMQSSETDVRDEELGPNEIEESREAKLNSSKNKSDDNELQNKVIMKPKSESSKDEVQNERSRSKSKSKSKSRDSSKEKNSNNRKTPISSTKHSRSNSKSRNSSADSNSNRKIQNSITNKSKSKSKERSLSATSPKDTSKHERRDRSRSVSEVDSRSSSQHNVKSDLENETTKTTTADVRSRKSSSKTEDQDDDRPSSFKDSNIRTPSGKRSSVSWHDETDKVKSRDRSKSAEHRRRESKSKSIDKEIKPRDRSKSAEHRRRKSKSQDDGESQVRDTSNSDEHRHRKSNSKSREKENKSPNISISNDGESNSSEKSTGDQDHGTKSKSIDKEIKPRDRSKSAEHRRRESKSKSIDKEIKPRDRSKSAEHKRRESKSKSSDKENKSRKSDEERNRKSKSKSSDRKGKSRDHSDEDRDRRSKSKSIEKEKSRDRSKSAEHRRRESKSQEKGESKSRDRSKSAEYRRRESKSQSRSKEIKSRDEFKSTERIHQESNSKSNEEESSDRSESAMDQLKRSKSKSLENQKSIPISKERKLSTKDGPLTEENLNELVELVERQLGSDIVERQILSEIGSMSRKTSMSKSYQKENDKEEVCELFDEIEAGKTINLQEAARRRSESLARDPSRSRSRSVSQSRQTSEEAKNFPSKPKSKMSKTVLSNRRIPTTSEEREIQLQEALLASATTIRPKKGSIITGRRSVVASTRNTLNSRSVKQYNRNRKTNGENDIAVASQSTAVIDSGFSDLGRGVTTSASEDHKTRLSSKGKSHAGSKRKVVTRRPIGSGSSSAKRKSIFSSSPKQFRAPRINNRFDTLIVHQMSIENGPEGDDTNSTSTRGGSITSEEIAESPRRRKPNLSRPRSKLTFSRGEDINDSRLSPRPRKNVDVDTPISVTQAMQASMRKYNLERTIFQELLELKRLQIRAGKANEQLLVKRLAENYRKAGYSVNFRDYEGPYNFRGFEKYLYDQLRLLQSNRRLLPRFAPSDDLEKLSMALKKMNATKLPYLEDPERTASVCDNIQCSHSTHRCHHAAHAYTGVPCAAYIGSKKTSFLPRVNPRAAPGPTQKDPLTRTVIDNSSRNTLNDSMNLSSPMQISISPRTQTQSPITLEVQQGSSTQVFTLPSKALDPSKNYYVSLSIKPNPTSPSISPIPPHQSVNITSRSNPGDVVDDGSISAPPPPAENDSEIQTDVDRDKHNKSM